jgi:hypothetical protein
MKQSRPLLARFVVLWGVMAAVAATPACSGQGEDPASTEATEGEAAEPSVGEQALTEADEAGEPGGKLLQKMLRESLRQANLCPEQQVAVREIQQDVRTKTRTAREARRALVLTVADGVAAGDIDDAKVGAGLDALVREVELAKPVVQDGLNRLHRTLDPAQREAVVRALGSQLRSRRDRIEGRGGLRGVVAMRLGRLATALELTPEQKSVLRERLRTEFRQGGGLQDRRGEHMARLREVGVAFASPAFDARQLDLGKDAPDLTRKVTTRLVGLTKVVAAELTTGQREKLAQMIRERAGAGNE